MYQGMYVEVIMDSGKVAYFALLAGTTIALMRDLIPVAMAITIKPGPMPKEVPHV